MAFDGAWEPEVTAQEASPKQSSVSELDEPSFLPIGGLAAESECPPQPDLNPAEVEAETCGDGLHELLAGVEAEHNRQMQRLRVEMVCLRAQLTEALHRNGDGSGLEASGEPLGRFARHAAPLRSSPLPSRSPSKPPCGQPPELKVDNPNESAARQSVDSGEAPKQIGAYFVRSRAECPSPRFARVRSSSPRTAGFGGRSPGHPFGANPSKTSRQLCEPPAGAAGPAADSDRVRGDVRKESLDPPQPATPHSSVSATDMPRLLTEPTPIGEASHTLSGEFRASDHSLVGPSKTMGLHTGKEKIAWNLMSGKENTFSHTIKRILDLIGVPRAVARAHTKMIELKKQEKASGNALGRFMNSAVMKFVCCLVIIVNALFIALQADETMRAQIEARELTPEWEKAEWTFTAWFALELLLRLGGERVLFLYGDDCWWNVLDTFLVLSSMATLFSAASAPSLTMARLLRLFRFTRILRVLRVIRFMQNFRIMVLAILQSFGTLVWVFVVLIFFMFFFAMIVMNGTADYIRDEGLDAAAVPEIKEMFLDLPTTLLSLFESITGGRDWHEVVAVLLAIHVGYGLIFVVYIFFMVFLVLNVVVGGVVKTTSEVYKRDKQMVVEEEQNKLRRYCEEIKGFFREADKDGSGTLTWEEFQAYLDDDKVKAYFNSLELDISQAHVLFTLLDTDSSDEVAIDEFVEGCMRLKGQARSIDVNLLLYEIEKTMVKVDNFSGNVDRNLERIDRVLSGRPASGRNSLALAKKSALLRVGDASRADRGTTPPRANSPSPARVFASNFVRSPGGGRSPGAGDRSDRWAKQTSP